MNELATLPRGSAGQAALTRVRATATRALAEHALVDGACPICKTSGVCAIARVAENNLDMAAPAP